MVELYKVCGSCGEVGEKLLRVKLKPGDSQRRGCLSLLKVGSVAECVRKDSLYGDCMCWCARAGGTA